MTLLTKTHHQTNLVYDTQLKDEQGSPIYSSFVNCIEIRQT